MRIRGVRLVGLLVIAVSLVTVLSCTERQPANGVSADAQLVELTAELVPDPGPDDESTLRLVLTEQDRSVADMATMSVDQFRQVHRRSPTDQATLIGRWLGRATRTLSGPAVTAHIARAAQELAISVPEETGDRSANDLLTAITASFNARLPNEPSDNPRNPAAENLRSTFQSSFVSATEG